MGYWLKLYTDILDDSKYFKLSKDVRLGMYELLLVAKKLETNDKKTGNLPDVEEIAFQTRTSIEDWKKILSKLVEMGFLELDGAKYKIVNYEKRQSKIPPKERMRQFRIKSNKNVMSEDTNMLRDGYEVVTKRNGEKRREEKEIEKSTETEVEKRREEKDTKPSSRQAFISEFITAVRVKFINGDQPKQVDDLVEDYGEDIVLEAAAWYGQNNPRNMGHALKSINTALAKGWNSKNEDVDKFNKKLAERILNGN